jgi:hypothetical protein
MASGHVNRIYRPNTWLHRPSLRREDFSCQPGAVHTWQIVLKKSFWGDERKFLGPPMRFARGDMGDHVVSSKIDYRPSQWR